MSCLQTWKINCHKKGDTFKAKLITLPFDITDCTFLMQFRKIMVGVNTNDVAFEWSSSDNSFIIDDAVNGILFMNKKLIDVEVGSYVSDFQITRANGDIETLYNAIIQIEDSISR